MCASGAQPARTLGKPSIVRMDYPGNLYVVAAPSGAGKSTLVKALLELDSHLALSISHTTESLAARTSRAASITSSTSRHFAG